MDSSCTVLHLSTGNLEPWNITILVSDDELASEDLLIGLPILRHRKVDTRTILEGNIAELNDMDCAANTVNGKEIGRTGRLMMSRIIHKSIVGANQPRVDYYRAPAG